MQYSTFYIKREGAAHILMSPASILARPLLCKPDLVRFLHVISLAQAVLVEARALLHGDQRPAVGDTRLRPTTSSPNIRRTFGVPPLHF